jgi:hypothetical protein
MQVRKRVAALVVAIAAAVMAFPLASSAQVTPIPPAVLDQLLALGPPGCPSWYGFSQPATGCTPYWFFAYISVVHVYDTFPFPPH